MLQARLCTTNCYSSNAARQSPFARPGSLSAPARSLQHAPSRRHTVSFNCLGSSTKKATVTGLHDTRSRQHSVVHASTHTSDPRKALRVAIADQLKGPHFNTWLYSKRFDADRLVIQARRLWYYATLLRPGALGSEGEFRAKQLEQLRIAADNAFKDIQKFRYMVASPCSTGCCYRWAVIQCVRCQVYWSVGGFGHRAPSFGIASIFTM